jgi:ribosomal protein S18 acetylase RimI-like enzyme
MKDCFKLKKYDFQDYSNTWLLVFKGKKMVGCLTIDKLGIIWNLCVGKTQREKGIGKQLVEHAVNYICKTLEIVPTLRVDSMGENKERLISMYTNFGFEIYQTDETNIYLKYTKCNLK